MTRQATILTVVTALILVATLALFIIPSNKAGTQLPPPVPGTGSSTVASIPDLIIVSAPTIGANVSSPLTVAGEARGNFYFEASFPAKLLDASGNVIAQAPAQAQSDWMTTNFVPFSVTLTYAAQPSGSHGTLVLKNDNPSGDPAKDKTLSIPVIFQ